MVYAFIDNRVSSREDIGRNIWKKFFCPILKIIDTKRLFKML